MGLIRGAAKLGAAAVVIKMGSDAMEKHEDKKAQRQQSQYPQQQQQYSQQQQQYPQQRSYGQTRSQSPMARAASPGHASYCNGNCGGQCMGPSNRAIEQAPAYEEPGNQREWYGDLKA